MTAQQPAAVQEESVKAVPRRVVGGNVQGVEVVVLGFDFRPLDAAETQRLSGHRDQVWDVTFTSDGKRAVSVSGSPAPMVPVQDASVRLWDLESGDRVREHGLPNDAIFQVAVSPDGTTALLATNEPFLRVWDLTSWLEVGQLEGHDGPVTGVEFVPGGERAVSVSVDGTLILWDVPRRMAVHRFGGHGEGLWSVAVGPDGRTAVSDSADCSMVLWDLETGAEIRSFQREDAPGTPGSSGQAILPNGRTALSCENDGLLIEWDLETGEEIRRLGTHACLRTRVVVSPDGRLAVTSGMDGTLMFWDLESGELIRRSTGLGMICDLAIAPDGQTIAFGLSDGTIAQWRLTDPSLAELKAWVSANRYLPELTCAERETYRIEPLCD